MNRLYIVLLLILLLKFPFYSQTDSTQIKSTTVQVIDYTNPKEYEIGGIKVNGVTDRDPNAIAGYAGLRVGNKIILPGQDIARAIKKLWKIKLFADIEISIEKTIGEIVFLQIDLKERPTLSRYSFKGVKKSKHDDLRDALGGILVKGGIITGDVKSQAIRKIKEYYIEKGYFNADVIIHESPDEKKKNTIKLQFDIKRNDRVKVADIYFVGNKQVSSKKLRKKMSNVKRKGTLFRKSKFVKSEYEEDKSSIIDYYNKIGFRDARIVGDTMGFDADGNIVLMIKLNEGREYKFNNIVWKGNSIYKDEILSRYLGIKKGDTYNKELLQQRLQFSPDGRDVSSLYMDEGYLFFRVEPVEVAVDSGKIDLEMRIYEGPQATIDKVLIAGNDRTNEEVIRRELRTRPGEKFSRSNIMRSQREIMNLGYFNPENLQINTPVDPQKGTVDIEYTVEEKPSDQLEMSAGYSGYGGLLGTLGVVFNNFSLKNINNKRAWNPLPQGDGQKLSVRVQTNNYFKSANVSFTEPWFGGKKRNSLTVGSSYSKVDRYGTFSSTRVFAGLGIPLQWPDDYFLANITLNLERLNLLEYQGYGSDNFSVNSGLFNNFSMKFALIRSSISEPIYPKSGSKMMLSLKATPPYSKFRSINYSLTEQEKEEVINNLQADLGDGVVLTNAQKDRAIKGEIDRRKFKWLEYHKWNFEAEWYYNIVGNLVMATSIKMGMLGYYDKEIGVVPFERNEFGGDGLSSYNSTFVGKDIYALRGYETSNFPENRNGGGTLFSKYTVELRYPISLSPTSTIYGLTFLQAGNSWGRFRDFNPFDVKRSVGVGLRAFLPMFGLLGFDYGFGIDKGLGDDAKWTDYGKFSVILGFEPE